MKCPRKQLLLKLGVFLLLGAIVAVAAIMWVFRPNMQFIYVDDVVLWNRLRPGDHAAIRVVQTDKPVDWKLGLRIDGKELHFDESLDLSQIREQASSASDVEGDPKYPPGTKRLLWNGVAIYVHDDSLLHLEINRIRFADRQVEIRTRLSNEWVSFSRFGVDEAQKLFGKPDRTHEFFMH